MAEIVSPGVVKTSGTALLRAPGCAGRFASVTAAGVFLGWGSRIGGVKNSFRQKTLHTVDGVKKYGPGKILMSVPDGRGGFVWAVLYDVPDPVEESDLPWFRSVQTGYALVTESWGTYTDYRNPVYGIRRFALRDDPQGFATWAMEAAVAAYKASKKSEEATGADE